MTLIVGVDIGGTFADFAAVDTERGTINTLKVLTTPQAPGQDIAVGLRRLADSGLLLGAIERFVHGTTVGVNTIIQRRGARVALFTTDGFTDILELARLRMPNPYSLFCERPPPLVAREHVFAIDERMSAAGDTLVAPQQSDVAAAVAKAQAAGCEVIVVSFLHAWRQPRHELTVADMIAGIAPSLPVFCGSEVWPVIREYERTTTAVLNAYVQPKIEAYLKQVSAELATAGVRGPLLLTTSIGGTMTAEAGRRDCVGMLLSGTASGVIGASLIAKEVGIRSVLTLDMGGTSADVALLQDGAPSFATGQSIGEFPLATTTVAVQSSGQGGGSIVWLDSQGVLQVGPVSAGSTPGPACFDRGGTAMTVTDAALIVGILGHGVIGFGAIKPRKELAEAAARPIAAKLGIDLAQLAEGVLKVTVSGMLIAIEQMLARAGVHASELTLMPFGGAGPMLGTLLAEAAGINRILIPASPGTLCAMGAAAASIRRDTMRTVLLPLSEAMQETLVTTLAKLEREAEEAVVAMVGPGQSIITRAADLRYRGQSFEITVPVDATMSIPELNSTFHQSYERTFGHADLEAPVQIVNLRVSSARPPPAIRLSRSEPRACNASSTGRLRLYSSGRWREAALFERAALAPGALIDGPAIVIQEDTTLLISPGWHAVVDSFCNIVLEQA
jgi:N-methylhydantoinase A